MILAIDPGPERSGWVYGNPLDLRAPCKSFGHDTNTLLLTWMVSGEFSQAQRVVIEDLVPRGQPLGHDISETLKWIGRFSVIPMSCVDSAVLMTRREVCYNLTGDGQCGDAGIRGYLIHRFGPGKAKAVGLKASPGPLYGLRGSARDHEYAALALAIAYLERPK